MASAPNLRVGIGYDSHRLAEGGPLRLGGLDIPHDRHAVGHSDADVLLHAATDALLGASALGDIGEMFPDTAAENRGRSSVEMLRLAYDEVRSHGWRLVNLDCTIHAERPKLGPWKDRLRRSLAEMLTIDSSQISVKAKTGEGLGPIGEGRAIAADCLVLIQRTS